MAKKKAAKKKPEKQPVKKQQPEKKLSKPSPRQTTLPGMADRKIAALENAALHYADVRDERMRWTKQEVDAKKEVQRLMHEQNRERYERDGIEIELVPEGENVRVRVRLQEPVDEPVDLPPEPIEEPVQHNGPDRDKPVADPDSEYESKDDQPSEF